MARGDANLVWAEGFASPFRLQDIIKPPRGLGLGPAQHAAAPARALWAGSEPEPPPPPGRAVRGDDAVTQAPVRARPSRPQLIDRTQGGRRQPRAFSSGSRVRTPAAVCARAGRRAFAGPTDTASVVDAQAHASRKRPAEAEQQSLAKAPRVPLGTVTASYNIVRNKAAGAARVRYSSPAPAPTAGAPFGAP